MSRYGEAAALPAFLSLLAFRSALTFGTISAASQLFPPHVAAAALAHPDNCTGEDSSSDLYVVSFVDLIRQATRFANAECRMFSLQRAFHSAFCVLHSALSFPFCLSLRCNQALDRLVSSSSTHCCASADDLSPGSPPGVLLLSDGSLLLEVGFTLRCFQRLSHPHFASLLCRWHDNSCTSGASIPVLSY